MDAGQRCSVQAGGRHNHCRWREPPDSPSDSSRARTKKGTCLNIGFLKIELNYGKSHDNGYEAISGLDFPYSNFDKIFSEFLRGKSVNKLSAET